MKLSWAKGQTKQLFYQNLKKNNWWNRKIWINFWKTCLITWTTKQRRVPTSRVKWCSKKRKFQGEKDRFNSCSIKSISKKQKISFYPKSYLILNQSFNPWTDKSRCLSKHCSKRKHIWRQVSSNCCNWKLALINLTKGCSFWKMSWRKTSIGKKILNYRGKD